MTQNDADQVRLTAPDPAGSAAIAVSHLVKVYKKTRAVDDISFDVHRGEVFAFLSGLYANYIVSHPKELAGPPRERPIAGAAEARSAASTEEWVTMQVAAAEAVLFREPKRCQLCHLLQEPPGADLPVVAPTRVPVRWLPQSRFDHGVHRLLQCTQCHAAPTSRETADVLLPRRETCQACHRPGGARDQCAQCHTYHAATQPAEMDGPLSIRYLATGSLPRGRPDAASERGLDADRGEVLPP